MQVLGDFNIAIALIHNNQFIKLNALYSQVFSINVFNDSSHFDFAQNTSLRISYYYRKNYYMLVADYHYTPIIRQ